MEKKKMCISRSRQATVCALEMIIASQKNKRLKDCSYSRLKTYE
jgi:hypothetical protein